VLVYDKECPACNNYCQLIRIQESLGELNIINAREDSDYMTEVTERGLDIDQGMVLKIGDEIYYGADAMHKLALMSTRSGLFNRVNYWIFKSGTLSRIIYPVLKFFRNLLLRMLGKTRINNLGVTGNDKF
jgi:predicted DCC family thiol-disulfide oxidoreductase YuxK